MKLTAAAATLTAVAASRTVQALELLSEDRSVICCKLISCADDESLITEKRETRREAVSRFEPWISLLVGGEGQMSKTVHSGVRFREGAPPTV